MRDVEAADVSAEHNVLTEDGIVFDDGSHMAWCLVLDDAPGPVLRRILKSASSYAARAV